MSRSPTVPSALWLPDESDGPRRDIDSEEVRRVYPDLPRAGSAADRLQYLHARDERAYDDVRTRFPQLVPPHRRELVSPD